MRAGYEATDNVPQLNENDITRPCFVAGDWDDRRWQNPHLDVFLRNNPEVGPFIDHIAANLLAGSETLDHAASTAVRVPHLRPDDAGHFPAGQSIPDFGLWLALDQAAKAQAGRPCFVQRIASDAFNRLYEPVRFPDDKARLPFVLGIIEAADTRPREDYDPSAVLVFSEDYEFVAVTRLLPADKLAEARTELQVDRLIAAAQDASQARQNKILRELRSGVRDALLTPDLSKTALRAIEAKLGRGVLLFITSSQHDRTLWRALEKEETGTTAGTSRTTKDWADWPIAGYPPAATLEVVSDIIRLDKRGAS